jgi:hypothetical protein
MAQYNRSRDSYQGIKSINLANHSNMNYIGINLHDNQDNRNVC